MQRTIKKSCRPSEMNVHAWYTRVGDAEDAVDRIQRNKQG